MDRSAEKETCETVTRWRAMVAPAAAHSGRLTSSVERWTYPSARPSTRTRYHPCTSESTVTASPGLSMPTVGAERVRSPRTLTQVWAYRWLPSAAGGVTAAELRTGGAARGPFGVGARAAALAVGTGIESAAGGTGSAIVRSGRARPWRTISATMIRLRTAAATAASPRLAPNDGDGDGRTIRRGGN